MYINCNSIPATGTYVNAYNLSNHMIYALDIYVISNDGNLLDDLLSLTEEGDPKLYLEIDGIQFPITKNSIGEGPLNPITYIKDKTDSKFLFISTDIANPDSTAIVGSYLTGTWEQGTNISNNDSILLKIELNTSLEDSLQLSGFGDGAFGYDADLIVGYGGFGLGSALTGLDLVIEESKLITRDLLYMYSDYSDTTATDIGIKYYI